jgi:adenylyltransferase/sulfurtransferase
LPRRVRGWRIAARQYRVNFKAPLTTAGALCGDLKRSIAQIHMTFAFTEQQMLRYARQIVLPEIGGRGQARLLESKVLLIGAGGLGSPLLLYLAAAGIGTIGVIDRDRVELSNLHRQVAHPTTRIGVPKTESAIETARALNPEISVTAHQLELGPDNAAALVEGYDLVADGSDNFATRDALHDACLELGRPLVSAAVQGFEGQLSTFKAHLGPPHPCYRCLFPSEPPADLIPTCAEGGILGPAAGALGCLQAVEVIKELLGLGESLSGFLLLYDALAPELRRIRIVRRPDCGACGRLARPAALRA